MGHLNGYMKNSYTYHKGLIKNCKTKKIDVFLMFWEKIYRHISLDPPCQIAVHNRKVTSASCQIATLKSRRGNKSTTTQQRC
jgi:hypothetical protein